MADPVFAEASAAERRGGAGALPNLVMGSSPPSGRAYLVHLSNESSGVTNSTAPSGEGWQLLKHASGGVDHETWGKVVGRAGQTDNSTFSFSTGGSACYWCVAYDNVDPTVDPATWVIDGAEASIFSTLQCPSVTGTSGHRLIALADNSLGAAAPTSPDNSMSVDATASNAGGNGWSFAAASKMLVAGGATGATSWTGSSIFPYGAHVIVLPATGGGGLSVTLDTVATGESVPSPRLDLRFTAGTVATGEAVPNPQLNQSILAGTVATGESVSAPNVAPVVIAGTVVTGESVFDPQLNLQVIADTVTTGEQLYMPVVATDAVTIITNLIGSDEHVREPSLTLHLLADAIATGESVPNPTVVPGGVTVLPSALSTGEAVHTPNVAQVISPSALATGESVYSPVLANGGFIVADTVASGEAVFAPRLNLRVLAGTTTTGESVPSPLVAFSLQVILGTVPPPNYYVHAPVVTRDAVPFGWGPTEYVRAFPMGRTSSTFGGPRLRTRSS